MPAAPAHGVVDPWRENEQTHLGGLRNVFRS
jgi:hypothetical protein